MLRQCTIHGVEWLQQGSGGRTGRAVVHGAGIMGLSSAYYLLKRGWEVTIVDPNPFGQGCSFGNGGMIVPSHFVPLASPGMVGMGLRMLPDPASPFGFQMPPSPRMADWSLRFFKSCTEEHVQRCSPILAALHMASRAEFESLAAEFDFGLASRGLVMLTRDASILEKEAHMAAEGRKLGLEIDELTASTFREVDPGVTASIVGGVHFRDDRSLDPTLFMEGLRDRVSAFGGRFVESEPSGEPDVTVLAVGAWTTSLAARHGVKIPMMAGKGYSFVLPDPPEMPEVCGILTEARVAYTPMARGLRFSGTMEIGEPNFVVNERRVSGILESIGSFFPAFDGLALPENVWVGNRPLTPDGMPCIGRVGRVLIAAGHGMMGLSLGPITGRLIADMACDPDRRLPRELSPTRFR